MEGDNGIYFSMGGEVLVHDGAKESCDSPLLMSLCHFTVVCQQFPRVS